MKDKDGFDIRCKHSKWVEINERGDEDIVCWKYKMSGYHFCYCDEYCKDYEPMEKGEVNEYFQ